MEFSAVVQARTDAQGGEVSPAQLWEVFEDEYLPAERRWGRFALKGVRTDDEGEGGRGTWSFRIDDRGVEQVLTGSGNGPIAAFVDALGAYGVDVRVLDYAEHAMSAGGDARAASYVECAVGERVLWGIGLHENILRASIEAVVSAVNRAER